MNQQEQILNELLDIEAMLQSALLRTSRLRVQLQVNQIPKKSKSAAKTRASKLEQTVYKNIRRNIAA
jgi:hypothetical protein